MPPYVKNTGMSSLSELFAMKKNLAYETKFEHQLSAMMKDFFHKKQNLKQDIRMVYNDLQSIKLSTGYSLDKAEFARSADGQRRRPSAPTIYLPPIGVRLVQKYIGVDVRRQSLIGENTPGRQQRTLDRILNQTIGVSKADSKYTTNTTKETTKKVEFFMNRDEKDTEAENDVTSEFEKGTKAENYKTSELIEENDKHENDTISIIITGVTESREGGNPFLQRNERPLDGTTVFKQADANENDKTVTDSQDATHQVEVINTANDLDSLTEEPNENQGKLMLDTDYNLTERRSSRSTFRGRSSTRLPSRSNTLSEYNLGVIGHPKGKSNIRHFYLDYGDGKLHDRMEIPKVKDCSRPWCNPHCKTCRNRTYSRPCFVLIPAEENVRKRLIPQDKRKLSLFQKPFTPELKTETSIAKNADDNNETDPSNNSKKTKAYGIENSEITHDMTGTEDGIKDEKNDVVNEETDKPVRRIFEQQKKGYSRKRMNELSMPRGGPPAEVRFSKISLRRKQEQLVEDERTKAFTKYEKENLTQIQGKISMFLALLNQQERKGKPVKMVDIPVRMDAINSDIPKNKKSKRKWQRSVHFNSRPRLLS